MTIAELERAERSQAVCRDILGSGESFEALDAPRWLAELSARGPKPAEGFDSVPPLICPWRRFFAPVSYTHLDVYKRQRFIMSSREAASLKMPSSPRSSEAGLRK